MKCPNCGFIIFPGNEECKKCGHHFTQVNGQAEGIPPLFHHLGPEAETPAAPEPESPLDQTELHPQKNGDLDVELEPQAASESPTQPEAEQPPQEPQQPAQQQEVSPWQAELAQRVQEYRQRRANFQKEHEAGHGTFNLDFGAAVPKSEENRPHIIEFPSAEGSANRPKPKPEVRSAPPSYGMRSFESAFLEEVEEVEEAGEDPSPPPPPPNTPSRFETGPLEIELGPSETFSEASLEDDASVVSIAQMSMRFYAALVDALVLLSGSGLFALIFWQLGGSFSVQPPQLAATVAIGAFCILLYFAGCTAIASATPGMICAGLEVITFEGAHPTLSDCLWRGFGYLVSMSALMLGFVWAAVDAEGLTWHDRMSRTFIVPSDNS